MDDSENIVELLGPPIPTARPRVTRFKGTYDPRAKEKKLAQKIVASQWCRELFQKPISLDLKFLMPIPKTFSKKKRAQLIGSPHVKKPDTDNLIKFIMDSMSGIVFKDDSCVYNLKATKLYSETPKTIIKVISS